MIGFGLRLAVAGGREALTRLVIIAAAVAVGAGLLLATFAGINAVNAQLTRYAALYPPSTSGASGDPLWWSTREDYFHGEQILRVDVAATGAASPVPVGIPRTPAVGEYYASSALQRLLAANPGDQLADRYPVHNVGIVGDAALTSPDTLLLIAGSTPELLAEQPRARQLTSTGDNAPALPETVVDLIMSVIVAGLLFPVLIFIGTATRLNAARREQRFAAMRLVGATPRQISVVAAIETASAALAGTALGFVLFFVFRDSLASIPFTGDRFFSSDISLGGWDVLLVAVGVPAGAALAAAVSLRRVRVSPLGITRRTTPRPPRWYRLVPLLLGLAELTFFLIGPRPETSDGQMAVFVPGLLLVMTGLLLAGPLLTMVSARVMARRSTRPAMLIAARRLADNPKAGFRAISGIMLALFITTVATGVITTIVANRGPAPTGSTDSATLSTYMPDGKPVPATTLAELRSTPGVEAATELRENPVKYAGPVVACSDIPAAYGRCAGGVTVAEVSTDLVPYGATADPARVWPASTVPLDGLATLPAESIVVLTDGSAAAIERARTALEKGYSGYAVAPHVPGDFESDFADTLRGWQQLADVVIVASLAIAGCSLAVSVIGGLTERKRPFSLLRLSGAPVQVLRRVVAFETAAPMVTAAVIAMGMGFLAAQLFLQAQMGYTLVAPGAAFYGIVIAGLAACLGIIASTLPLLERITGPETARSE
ncbi:ABC transporter permease [Actinoplanes sp. TBRC 11911]|uniref:FtsX-like permease family protein n=1 Tax=Actinoplanes sp. TBRC 11911 TaxID=2729386 RepID=UPI00145F5FCE|nr:FtsX-like permease family protein [Actinoplanes sp. TBRC 11911]NMO53714.1 ABC transporter permease [Actinoplanes sp. TBRC 11911]